MCIRDRFNLSELLAKDTAAKSKNGTVGKIGKTAPNAPNPNPINPSISHNIFLIFTFFNLSFFSFACNNVI